MDPIKDPGWLYSSLAQASAAIVGLVGAFFGARLIEHFSAYARVRATNLDPTVREIYATIQERRQRLPELEAFLQAVLPACQAALARGEQRLTRQDFVGWEGRGGHVHIDPIRQFLPKAQQDLAALPVIRAAYPRLQGEIRESDVSNYAAGLQQSAAGLHGQADEPPKKLLLSDAENLHHLSKKVREFRGGLVPGSFLAIFAVLLFLSVGGIVLPLRVLPGLPNPEVLAHKTLLLGSFTVGLGIFLAYFGFVLLRLYRLRDLAWPEM